MPVRRDTFTTIHSEGALLPPDFIDVGQRDRFGRLLAYVYRGDGTFPNAALIADGYAQTMTIPPNVQHAKELQELQRRARSENRGLWAACQGS